MFDRCRGFFPPMAVWEIAQKGHRKSHFKRTQYWKHSSVKQPRNAVEPLKSNKYVALNCRAGKALIFKPFFPTKAPETCPSWEKQSTCYQARALKPECPCVHILVHECVVFTKTESNNTWGGLILYNTQNALFSHHFSDKIQLCRCTCACISFHFYIFKYNFIYTDTR